MMLTLFVLAYTVVVWGVGYVMGHRDGVDSVKAWKRWS